MHPLKQEDLTLALCAASKMQMLAYKNISYCCSSWGRNTDSPGHSFYLTHCGIEAALNGRTKAHELKLLTDFFFPQRFPSVLMQCALTLTDCLFPFPTRCNVCVDTLQQCWTSWRSSWVTWRPMWLDCPTCCPGSRQCRLACRCLRGASWADSPAGATSRRHSRWDTMTKMWAGRWSHQS